jgi:hypothetical protein
MSVIESIEKRIRSNVRSGLGGGGGGGEKRANGVPSLSLHFHDFKFFVVEIIFDDLKSSCTLLCGSNSLGLDRAMNITYTLGSISHDSYVWRCTLAL